MLWELRVGGLCTKSSWLIRALRLLRIHANAWLESQGEGEVPCACTVRGHVIHTQTGTTAMALWMRCACANNIDQTAKCHLHSIVIVAAAFVVVVDVAISTPPLSPLLPLPGRHGREGEREREHTMHGMIKNSGSESRPFDACSPLVPICIPSLSDGCREVCEWPTAS